MESQENSGTKAVNDDKNKSAEFKKMGKRTKEKLKYEPSRPGEMSLQEATRVIHELRAHQMELERQNEELRACQREMEESGCRYANLYDFAHVSYFVFDREGLILDLNLAGARLLGLEKENLVKKPFNLFVARQDQDRFCRHRKEVFETGKRLSCELRLVTKDGRELHGRFDSHVVKDANGTISQCQTTISDVTKRKHAEGVLRLHEMRLKALLDLNKMAGASQQEILDFVREEVIRITQSQFAFIGFMNDNESVMRIDNWSQGAMAQCAALDKPMRFSIAGGGLWAEPVRQRKRIIVNDYSASHLPKRGLPRGHVPIDRFLGVPVFDGERIVAVVAVANKLGEYDESDVRAITTMVNDAWRLIRNKCAEDEIENLAKFPSENPNPVLRVAKDGMVLYANDAGSILLESWDCKVGEQAPAQWRPYMLGLLESGLNGELEVVCKDRVFSLMIASVVDSGYANVYGIDITERKQAEEDIKNYRHHLEELVQTRTAELTHANKALQQEIDQRMRLEKEIQEISEREQKRLGQELHDSLGQQLAGISLLSKVVEKKLTARSAKEAPDVAEITELVKQAMDQTRDLARGISPVDLEEGGLMTSLQELAKHTENLFNIRCTFKCDESCEIDGPLMAVHLYRITQEAITNAVKHGKTKNIQIELVRRRDGSVLTVKNDGLDFPEVFTARGPGMGLQIMGHRADIIGASLDIRKAAEGGTIVTCSLPNQTRGPQ